MAGRIEFSYAQARLQARHGAWPDAAAWQALEASHTAGHALSLARAGVFAPWVDGLADVDDTHRIERHFRARWRAHVDEVARWLPVRWRPALRWFGLLGELPLVDALRREGQLPPWLMRDGRLAGAAGAGNGTPSGVGTGSSGDADVDADLAALLAPPHGDGADTAARWRAGWVARLPVDAGAASATRASAVMGRRGDPGRARNTGAPACAELLSQAAGCLLPRLHEPQALRDAGAAQARQALQRLWRHHAGTSVAVIAHLALVALLLERLRGVLVARRLFEPATPPLASAPARAVASEAA